MIHFDLYARRTDFLETKNGSRHWEKLENKRKKET